MQEGLFFFSFRGNFSLKKKKNVTGRDYVIFCPHGLCCPPDLSRKATELSDEFRERPPSGRLRLKARKLTPRGGEVVIDSLSVRRRVPVQFAARSSALVIIF